jgi:hypothetical protein
MRAGSWYQQIEIGKVLMLVVLNQIRILDYKRLDDKMATLNTFEFDKLIKKFNQLYQPKNMPPKKGGRG